MRLGQSIIDLREQVRLCVRCFNVTAEEECTICRDLRRDPTVVCVVERAQDIAVLERTQEFRGRYHVLGGCHLAHRGHRSRSAPDERAAWPGSTTKASPR